MKKLLLLLLLAPLFVFGQTQVKFNQINPTLPADFKILNNGHRFGTDSASYGTLATYAAPVGSIYFIGTSITAGTGITAGGTKYSTLVANALGLTEVNNGLSGATVENRTGGSTSGSFISLAAGTPSYSPTGCNIVVVECGPNDFVLNYPTNTNYTPTNYNTDLTAVINYLHSTKGFPFNRICIVGNTYIQPARYNGTQTLAGYQLFQAQSLAVATALSTLYCDPLTWFTNRGGDAENYDALHPSNNGAVLLANLILSVLQPPTVYTVVPPGSGLTSRNVAVNGNSVVANLNLQNNNIIPVTGGTLLGRDATGNIGQINSLPPYTLTGSNLVVTGKVLWNSSPANVTSATINSGDILFNGNNKMITYYTANSGYWTNFVPCDAAIGFGFHSSFNASNANIASFYNGNGDQLVFSILQGGNVTASLGSFKVASGSVGLKDGFGYGWFYPGDSNANTTIANSYNTGTGTLNGNILFLTAPVTNGVTVEAARLTSTGHLLFGLTRDDGYTISNAGTTSLIGNTNFGQLIPTTLTAVPSTSGGTIAAGNHYYKYTVIDGAGQESLGGSENGIVTTGSTSSVALTATAIIGATAYRFYTGTTNGLEDRYIQSSTNTATDIGSGYTVIAPPKKNLSSYAQVSSAGVATFANVNINSAQTPVNGSTSGTSVFSEPQQGPTYKMVLIKMSALVGTASYTFPTAFTTTPSVVGSDDVAAGIVTTKSTTAVTVTGTTSTGTLMLTGY